VQIETFTPQQAEQREEGTQDWEDGSHSRGVGGTAGRFYRPRGARLSELPAIATPPRRRRDRQLRACAAGRGDSPAPRRLRGRR
jgi:hypothetical protein